MLARIGVWSIKDEFGQDKYGPLYRQRCIFARLDVDETLAGCAFLSGARSNGNATLREGICCSREVALPSRPCPFLFQGDVVYRFLLSETVHLDSPLLPRLLLKMGTLRWMQYSPFEQATARAV